MKTIFRTSALMIMLLTISFSVHPSTCRNVLNVYIDSHDRIFVEQELMDFKNLKDAVKSYIENMDAEYDKADWYESFIAPFGDITISKGLISIQCERNTTYGFYVEVQNELEKAFNELRNEFAIAYFNIAYKKLNRFRRSAIDNAIPKSISEAEPNFVRNEKGELVRNRPRWYYY